MSTRTRRKLIRNVLLLGAVGAATVAGSQVGCSSPGVSTAPPESTVTPQGTASGDREGTIGMELTLPGGEQLNSVTWTLTNSSGVVIKKSTVMVTNSLTINILIGGIPAGSNYTLTLTGTTASGTVTCAGSATFNTTARMTTSVSIALQCNTAPPEAGSVAVTATTFNCATVDGREREPERDDRSATRSPSPRRRAARTRAPLRTPGRRRAARSTTPARRPRTSRAVPPAR